jgi:hypothetical protein
MAGVQLIYASGQSLTAACVRCQAVGCPWDRIGDQPICPDCEEQLALGEAEPLVDPLAKKKCLVCEKIGTVRYLTFPLHSKDPLAIDLCPLHFHEFLIRKLDRYTWRILVRHLREIGLAPRQIFLLHEAFYDDRGYPLHPLLFENEGR